MSRDANVESMHSELNRLKKTQRDIARAIANKRGEILRALPAANGFEDMDSLVYALSAYTSKSLRDRIGSPSSASRDGRKGKRFSAESRVEARKALEAGASLAEVARRTGACVATVARWAQTYGISRRRWKKRRGTVRAEAPPSNTARDPADANGQEVHT
jgi:hypothetical protein